MKRTHEDGLLQRSSPSTGSGLLAQFLEAVAPSLTLTRNHSTAVR